MTQELDLFGEQPAESPFDAIRQTDGEREWWSARDLMPLLGYEKWERFEARVQEAKIAADLAGVPNQFPGTGKMVRLGSGAIRELADYSMSRYACYVVAMSCDGRKQQVAEAKHYFAVKSREAEVAQPRQMSKAEMTLEVINMLEADVEAERVGRLKAEAQIEADRPMVAKAKAHSSNGQKLITRTEFAREIIAYCAELEPPVHVPYQQAMDFLHEINLFTKSGTGRADAGQATTWAIRERYAKTEKGIAPNGYPWATGKLTRAGQDFAWSRVVRRLNKTGSLAPVERKRGLAA